MQYLYLIHCRNGYQDFYKVGVANDVESRLAQLQTGNPLEMQLLGAYGFDNAEIPERAIHQAWKKDRVRGEWFNGINPDDVYENFREICDILGGEYLMLASHEASPEEEEEAEELSNPVDGAKWDYAAMFADGWQMEYFEGRRKTNGTLVKTGQTYWQWNRSFDRKRQRIYGGNIKELPYSIENMRRVFRDGLTPQEAEVK